MIREQMLAQRIVDHSGHQRARMFQSDGDAKKRHAVHKVDRAVHHFTFGVATDDLSAIEAIGSDDRRRMLAKDALRLRGVDRLKAPRVLHNDDAVAFATLGNAHASQIDRVADLDLCLSTGNADTGRRRVRFRRIDVVGKS